MSRLTLKYEVLLVQADVYHWLWPVVGFQNKIKHMCKILHKMKPFWCQFFRCLFISGNKNPKNLCVRFTEKPLGVWTLQFLLQSLKVSSFLQRNCSVKLLFVPLSLRSEQKKQRNIVSSLTSVFVWFFILCLMQTVKLKLRRKISPPVSLHKNCFHDESELLLSRDVSVYSLWFCHHCVCGGGSR